MICPACVASAAMTVAGVTGTSGGMTAIAWRILRWKKGTRLSGLVRGIGPKKQTLHAAGEAAQR